MATCDTCGTTILFGGVRDGQFRFCNEKCRQQGFLVQVAGQIPEEVVAEQIQQVHEGDCPRCGGRGPVDVHTSYRIWSVLVMTSWRSRPEICCRGCGIKSQLVGAGSSMILGWWGIPWGVIMTPVQVLRNLSGLAASPDPTRPSDQLDKLVRIHIAAHVLSQPRPEPEEAEG